MTLKTTREVAKHFSVTPKTVRGWTKRGCPCQQDPARLRRKLYRIQEVQTWLERQGLRAPGDPQPVAFGGHPPDILKAVGLNPDLGERAQQALVRKKEAEAELAEIALAQKRCELVSKAAVDERIGQAIESAKAGFMAVPRKYCDYLAGHSPTETRRRLTEVVSEVLGVFSGALDE